MRGLRTQFSVHLPGLLIALGIVFGVCGTVPGQCEITKLLPSDGSAGDTYGVSTAIDGDMAVVGALMDDDNGPQSGSAYVFHRNGSAWVQQAKLLASDGAGPVSAYYLASAKARICIVQGGDVLLCWITAVGNNSAIAVDTSVRTAAAFPGNVGAEYTLEGEFLGFLPENEILSGDMFDGTSDGTNNFSVNRITGEVMRFDLDWTNPQILFNVSAGDYLGITYDSDTDTLWLSGYGIDVVENYDMTGKLLSGFEVPAPEGEFIPLTALALDHADGTLWFGRQEFIGRYYQYSRSGQFLSQQIYPELADENILGGEFVLPKPPQLDGYLDIKPGSCPNPLNRNSHGMMPAAILGTDEVDASQIDVSSVLLSRADGVGGSVAPNEGPPGPHSVLEDVGTPFDGEPCDCHELEGDGVVDLLMHFQTQELVEVLELDDLPLDTFVELIVTGVLMDKTPFSANDCIRLVPAGDMDGDGAVGATDLIMLISSWGSCSECIDCPLDLDGDCSVGAADLLILLANWG